MKKIFKKHKKVLLGLVAFVFLIAAFSLVYFSATKGNTGGTKSTTPTASATPTVKQETPKGETTENLTPTQSVTSAPEKSKKIVVKVVDKEGKETVYEHATDCEFLREATEEIESLTIEGAESVYGLMIESINGLRAVYEKDGAYWSITVDGEYGMNGIDTQPVTDGGTYAFVYTEA